MSQPPVLQCTHQAHLMNNAAGLFFHRERKHCFVLATTAWNACSPAPSVGLFQGCLSHSTLKACYLCKPLVYQKVPLCCAQGDALRDPATCGRGGPALGQFCSSFNSGADRVPQLMSGTAFHGAGVWRCVPASSQQTCSTLVLQCC